MKIVGRIAYLGMMFVALHGFSMQVALAQAQPRAELDFSHQIVPLIRLHCAECHTGEALKGGFSMNDRASLLRGSESGPVIDLTHPESSLLLELITSEDKDVRMPPKGPGLSAQEINLLKRWIAEELPWETGFAFKNPVYQPPLRPRKVELPPTKDKGENAVDLLMHEYFARQELPTPAPISDSAFLRRVYLDLIGLLPTPEDTVAFMANSSPDKRSALVRTLLARDVDYTEHWLTFWNDLLRNDYGGTGFITGGRKQISAWLYESLLNNKPFDQFTREIIAPPTAESEGFIDGIKWRGEVSAGQTVEIQFAQSVGQAFLGINLKCASCHDSFIDQWKLDEAYGLAAIYSDRPLEVHRCDLPQGRMATASWLFPELGQVDAMAPRAERLKQLSALMTHPENGRFTRTIVNRLWHRLMGRGIVHPLDAMQSEPWNADLLDYLANHLQENGYDLKETLELIATSKLYQAQAEVVEEPGGSFNFKGPRARRLTAEQFVDAVWTLTGTAPTKMDAVVIRSKLNADAEGVADTNVPQWIWGDSAAGEKLPPANETIALRYRFAIDASMKRAAAVITCDNEHTLYVNGTKLSTSQIWEQVSPVALETLLNPTELNEILVVAKNAGAAPNPAGLFFDLRVILEDGRERRVSSGGDWEWSAKLPNANGKYGKAVDNWQPVVVVPALKVWSDRTKGPAAAYLSQLTQGELPMIRSALLKSDFLMRSLGRPNRDQIVSMRPDELTTLEAIDLSNGEVLADLLTRGAEHLLQRDWATSTQLVEWIYLHALSREPNEFERKSTLEVLGSQPSVPALADVLWAVIMQPEFQYVY